MSRPASGHVVVGGGGATVAVGAAVTGVMSLVASVFVVLFAAAGITSAAPDCGLAGAGQSVTVGDASIPVSAEQAGNAAAIIAETAREHLPPRAAVIAVATGFQESSLHNLDHGDADSLGLFQQRPSQGYNATDAVNPARATAAFLARLVALGDWPSLPLTEAAARVQLPREDLRGAYAQWEPLATALVTQYWPSTSPTGTFTTGPTTGPSSPARGSGTTGTTSSPASPSAAASAMPVDWGGGCPVAGGEGAVTGPLGTQTLPSGVVLTGSRAARTAAGFAIAQLGKPYVYGAAGPDAWDCSSLVQAAWAAAGVAIPRTTYTQVGAGIPVTYDQARTGDLVFIPGSDGTPANPGHVGMVLGVKDGQLLLIQAPQSGENVKISALSGWTSQIVAIRRIG